MSETTRPNRFETLPEMKLAGVREAFAFEASIAHIPEMWKRFTPQWPLPGQNGTVAYGAMCGVHDEGRTLEYIAAVEVASFDDLPTDLGRMIVPAARYAVFRHEGDAWTLPDTWARAINDWLPLSNFDDRETPAFERFAADFDHRHGTGLVEIFLPVVEAESAPA